MQVEKGAKLLFKLVQRLEYDEAEISAGAHACDTERLAVGTFSGWACFDLASFHCVLSQPAILPKWCDFNGIQFCGRTVLLLGNHKSQSLAKPCDWAFRIYVAGLERSPETICELPAGNWRMVRNVSGPCVYLYDVSEGAGVIGWNLHGKQWHVKGLDVTKAFFANEQLACLCKNKFVVFSLDGEVEHENCLPLLDEYCWTTMGADICDRLMLGGYRKESHAYVLTRISVSTGEIIGNMLEIPLDSVFTPDKIEDVALDECCGNDLFEVAKILPFKGDQFFLGLGGNGEGLGACQGASALAVADMADSSWHTQVVDLEDGISGLMMLGAEKLLADFCGDIRIYSFRAM